MEQAADRLVPHLMRFVDGAREHEQLRPPCRMNFRKARPEEPEINLIPFIDVLLVVLIFLMLSTTYSKFTELQVTLPVADAEKLRDRPREIIVVVSRRRALRGQPQAGRGPQRRAAGRRARPRPPRARATLIVIVSADADRGAPERGQRDGRRAPRRPAAPDLRDADLAGGEAR